MTQSVGKSGVRANFKQDFYFEHSVVRLRCGGLFRPLNDAVGRWAKIFPAASGAKAEDCFVLYEHRDGRFVMVKNQDCQVVDVLVGRWFRTTRKMWCSERVPLGQVVEKSEALEFVREIQAPVPESLSSTIEEIERRRREQAEVPAKDEQPQTVESIRPLQHWKDLRILPLRRSRDHDGLGNAPPAHEVDYNVLARDCYSAAVELVQTLRRSPRGQSALRNCSPRWLANIVGSYFDSYPVQLEHWQGSDDVVPPESVTIVELRWPSELRKVLRAIERVQRLVDLPAQCLAAWTRQFEGGPSNAEALGAYQKLVAHQELIENATVNLGKALRELAIVGREDPKNVAEPGLPKCVVAALNAYDLAEKALYESGETTVTDDTAYAWLREFGPVEYDLPALDSWKRYLRRGRRRTGISKNSPLIGRTGRSIANANEI